MKRLLLTVLPLLLIVGCSKPINEETLIDKDGLKYHPETKELYSGKVFQNRMGGEKEFEGSYIDGKKDGVWTYWFTNGQKKEGTMKDGKKDGVWTILNSDGKKEREGTYKDGNLSVNVVVDDKTGLSTPSGGWTYYHKDGTIIKPINKNELVYKDGIYFNKETDIPYSGPCFEIYDVYDEYNKRQEGIYKDGKRDGLWIYLDKTYKEKDGFITYVTEERTYKDGKKDGLSTGWYSNGQKDFEIIYKDGKEDGFGTSWYSDGVKRFEGTFKYGKVISSIEWNEDGSLKK